MHLRKATCRGAVYETDYSAAAHGAHEFFPHAWAGAVTCYGWTEAEAEAAAVVEQVRSAPDGAVLEAHPAVLAGISQLLAPDFPGEDDARIGHQVTRLFGVKLTPAPLERGQWRITADEGQAAEGTVRDD